MTGSYVVMDSEEDRMIKVLMVLTNLRVSNGVASFVMNYLRHMNPDEVDMDFALYSDVETPYYDEVKVRGGTIFILPPVRRLKQHRNACRKILQEGEYQIVHNNTMLPALPIMWCAKRMEVPVRILHSHSSRMGETPGKERRNKLLLPLLKRQCNVNFACSKLAGEAMFGDAPFTIILNAIDIKKYAPNAETREKVRKALRADGKRVVGSVGRLSPQKNPFFAVDVFAELVKLMPNAEYWWIGTGLMDMEVRDYVAQKGLTDHVFFLGNRTDVPELYQGMDIFFMPSNFEGLPVTAVEAQAAGLPCVLSDTITREVVYTDQVQFVPLEEGTDRWARTLANQMGKREEMSELGSHKDAFDIKRCVERLLAAYKENLQK